MNAVLLICGCQKRWDVFLELLCLQLPLLEERYNVKHCLWSFLNHDGLWRRPTINDSLGLRNLVLTYLRTVNYLNKPYDHAGVLGADGIFLFYPIFDQKRTSSRCFLRSTLFICLNNILSKLVVVYQHLFFPSYFLGRSFVLVINKTGFDDMKCLC